MINIGKYLIPYSMYDWYWIVKEIESSCLFPTVRLVTIIIISGV